MALVNELIPDADVEKYAIKEINKRFVVGATSSRHWTIDRERDIFCAAWQEGDMRPAMSPHGPSTGMRS